MLDTCSLYCCLIFDIFINFKTMSSIVMPLSLSYLICASSVETHVSLRPGLVHFDAMLIMSCRQTILIQIAFLRGACRASGEGQTESPDSLAMPLAAFQLEAVAAVFQRCVSHKDGSTTYQKFVKRTKELIGESPDKLAQVADYEFTMAMTEKLEEDLHNHYKHTSQRELSFEENPPQEACREDARGAGRVTGVFAGPRAENDRPTGRGLKIDTRGVSI